MGSLRSSGRERSCAHTGLVGVNAAHNPPGKSAAHNASKQRISAKCAGKNHRDHAWELAKIHNNNYNAKQQINQRHNGGNDRGNMGQPLNATKSYIGHQRNQDDTSDCRINI
jgi:hypothetical protein